MSAKRLAVVLSHPTQYYSPWFRWVSTHTSIEFRVFYLWNFGVTGQRDPKFEVTIRWDVDLVSGYEHEFIPNTSSDPGTHHFTGLKNPSLIDRLSSWKPDAVLLFGYNWSAHARALIWARRRRIPLLFRGDSHFLGRGLPAWPKRLILRTLYAQFAAVLPVGVANSEYFFALGVPPQRQFLSPHSVDDELFDPTTPAHLAASARLRTELNIGKDNHVVLFAGKFVPEKQPLQLLETFLRLARNGTCLVFVGDGPEKAKLLSRANGSKSVRFLPFANQTEMPARYLLADIFALPSIGFYETWGLAVNEAMHMGTPALVSNRVGCQRDLVTDGETGWVFPATDGAALARALDTAITEISRPNRRQQLRTAVRSRIAGYTFRQTTAGLTTALRAIGLDVQAQRCLQ